MSKIGEAAATDLFDKDYNPAIEVGDEVRNESGIGVITAIREEDGVQILSVMGSDGVHFPDAPADKWELTGKHFAEVGQILKNIGRFG